MTANKKKNGSSACSDKAWNFTSRSFNNSALPKEASDAYPELPNSFYPRLSEAASVSSLAKSVCKCKLAKPASSEKVN